LFVCVHLYPTLFSEEEESMSNRVLLVMALVTVLAALLPLTVAAQEAVYPPHKGIRSDAPRYGVHGPYWVGTTTIAAQTDLHPTHAVLWYPAFNPDGLEEANAYPFDYWPPRQLTVSGHAFQEAAPDTTQAPYPLVIFAHGWTASPYTTVFLCEHLASQGFVVMAIEYADNSGTENTATFEFGFYTRPRDVTWQIDYAATLNAVGGPTKGMIDLERVAVVGYSLGGETALAIAGGRLDLSGLEPICSGYPAYQWMCTDIDQQGLARLAGLDEVPQGMRPSWSDSRVDSMVALSPWVLGLSADSLHEITIPAMVVVGSADSSVIPEFEFYKSLAYDSLGSAMKSFVVFENGDHLLWHNTCQDWPWLMDDNPESICHDLVWDMDRAHDLLNHFVTAFLLATLNNEPGAVGALKPSAPRFPGITLERTGF
jgi:predicted dienelactone hydrolase